MYQQQPNHSNVFRLRPVSAQRSQKQSQRRSVAVTTDLHRYYAQPASTVYLPQQFPAPSSISSSSNQHRNSRPKLPQRPTNINSRPQPMAFPTIPIEKSGTLSRQQRHQHKTIEVENTVGSNATSHFLKWLRKRQPKPTSQPPPPLNNRANWTGSLPRNFSIRLPTNGPTRPNSQKARVVKATLTKPVQSVKQRPAPTRPSLNRLNYAADVDGHYDNAPSLKNSGYYNVNLGSTTNLTSSQKETADKYATISRRNLPRYDTSTANQATQKANFNTLPRKLAPPPPEPVPDYSDSRSSSSSSLSPTPNPTARVRFNLSQNEMVELPAIKKDETSMKQSAPIVEHRDQVQRPRGLLARTFERKIYKKLKPLIQIKGIRVDEKEIVRLKSTTRNVSPPPQRSILTNNREKLSQQNSSPPTFSSVPDQPFKTKRPAPPPPKEESIERLTSPYDNSEKLDDKLPKNGSGVCYVEGNRIEYRLEWSGKQLLIHYESRNLNDELQNTADSEIISELLAESEATTDLLVPHKPTMAILPQRGTITNMEYTPGLVNRLREKFTQMAKQSTSNPVVLNTYRRFSSMDDILSSEGSDAHGSQTLPRMKVSKSVNENLSSTTTGYSSEESSSQSSDHKAPQSFPRNSTEIHCQSCPTSTSKEQAISRITVDENTSPRVSFRSLRQKFENQQTQTDPDFKKMQASRSNSAHTVAKYYESPTKSFSKDDFDYQSVSMQKSPTFPTSHIKISTLPRTLKPIDRQSDMSATLPKNNKQLVNEVVRLNNDRSTSPSSASSECFPRDEVIQETSDELESIASSDESAVRIVRSSPLASISGSDKFFPIPDNSFNPTQNQMESFKSTASHMYSTLPSTIAISEAQQKESVLTNANKRRVTFTLPLEKSSMYTGEEMYFVDRPGSTPMNEIPTAKTAALKDASGMLEVHQLLNKFNAKRLAEQKQENTDVMPVVCKKYDSPVNINSADRSPLPRTFHDNSFTSHSNGNNSTLFVSSTPPARKSLSARYLESKQQQQSNVMEIQQDSLADQNAISENFMPNVDRAILEDEDNTSVSSMDSLDIVEEIVDCQPLETMFASECGPIRRSLLNLVLQEDIAHLLEAMSEELHFVFEDYSSAMQPNGIIMNGSKRRGNMYKSRAQNRICFNESPSVFTYLDESSALEEGQWKDGRMMTYEDYLKLTHDTQDQAAKQALELSKWRSALHMKLDCQEESMLKATASQLAQASLQPPLASSPSSSRTPTPDEISVLPPRYTFTPTPQRPIPTLRQECGTSAI